MKKILMTGLFLLLVSVSVFAFDGYIEITNNTGYTIYYIYVSHEYSDSWEEDVLDDEVLMDGDSFTLNVSNYPTSVFDVKLEDEDGDTYTVWGIDIAYDDLEVTLENLD